MSVARRSILIAALLVTLVRFSSADEKPIVGLIPKAQKPIVMDGRLDDWQGAFITPLNARHPNLKTLHVFPAMPVSACVELGRVRQPKADPLMCIYDEQRPRGGFIHALSVPNKTAG